EYSHSFPEKIAPQRRANFRPVASVAVHIASHRRNVETSLGGRASCPPIPRRALFVSVLHGRRQNGGQDAHPPRAAHSGVGRLTHHHALLKRHSSAVATRPAFTGFSSM